MATLVIATGIVGAAATLTRLGIRTSFDKLLRKKKWYKKLPELKRHRLSGALTVVLHHCAIVGGLAFALKTNNADLYEQTLACEFGFDVFDSGAAVSVGSFTGVAAPSTLIHHTVAIFFTYVGMQSYLVRWEVGANLGINLLAAGAVDVFMLRVLPFTPLYKSDLLMTAASIAHLAVFVKCRLFHFIGSAKYVLDMLDSDSPLWKPLAIASGAMLVYHIMLGAALVRAALNKGRLPKISKEFREAMARRKAARQGESIQQASNLRPKRR